jgi:hypothetical protein
VLTEALACDVFQATLRVTAGALRGIR